MFDIFEKQSPSEKCDKSDFPLTGTYGDIGASSTRLATQDGETYAAGSLNRRPGVPNASSHYSTHEEVCTVFHWLSYM